MFATNLPDHLRRLRQVDGFGQCGARDLRRIEHLATAVTVPAGRVLAHHGEVGRECFIVLDGEIDVDVNGRLHTLGPGALLGEVALLAPGGRRTATITALTDVTLFVFTRTEFRALMTSFPAFAHRTLRESTRRLVEDIRLADE